MKNLQIQLESTYEVEANQILHTFEKIADLLMSEYAIHYKNSIYLFDEIEFYFCSKNHIDPYSHSINEKNLTQCKDKKNNLQNKMLYWYFHGSGIDITFGDENKKIYGGILIRKIFDVQTKKIIGGPLKLREHILGKNTAKAEECKNIVKPLNIKESKLCLIPYQSQLLTLTKLPRHGLNPIREKDSNFYYYCKPYRFLRERNI